MLQNAEANGARYWAEAHEKRFSRHGLEHAGCPRKCIPKPLDLRCFSAQPNLRRMRLRWQNLPKAGWPPQIIETAGQRRLPDLSISFFSRTFATTVCILNVPRLVSDNLSVGAEHGFQSAGTAGGSKLTMADTLHAQARPMSCNRANSTFEVQECNGRCGSRVCLHLFNQVVRPRFKTMLAKWPHQDVPSRANLESARDLEELSF